MVYLLGHGDLCRVTRNGGLVRSRCIYFVRKGEMPSDIQMWILRDFPALALSTITWRVVSIETKGHTEAAIETLHMVLFLR